MKFIKTILALVAIFAMTYGCMELIANSESTQKMINEQAIYANCMRGLVRRDDFQRKDFEKNVSEEIAEKKEFCKKLMVADKKITDEYMTKGYYQLGEYRYHIPRKYIWQGRFEDELPWGLHGTDGNIYMMAFYPSMEHATWNDDFNPERIKFNFDYSEGCKGDITCPKKQLQWRYSTRVLSNLDQPYILSTTINSPVYDKVIGLNHFEVRYKDQRSDKKIYYQGDDPYHPEFWWVCKIGNPQINCNTIYEFRPFLLLKLIIRYDQLKDYKKIRAALSKLMQGFEVPNDTSPYILNSTQ